jgi:parvulin-like peptidyl-prolyl isomerase
MRALLLTAICVGGLAAGTVIDRMAVVVGKHVIKSSDIDRDLRVTEFLNREPLVEDVAARKKSAERLIDQQMIREELSTGGYARAGEADAAAMLAQLRKDAYGNSEARLTQALQRYGLTEAELRAQLLWQLTVLRFIDQRFRVAVQTTDDEVRKYYEQHRAEFKGDFDSVAPSVKATLEGEQINELFERWLTDARKRNRIEYREEAFR